MKKFKWMFAGVTIVIVAVICYLILRDGNAKPGFGDLGKNDVKKFDYGIMTDQGQMKVDCQFPNPTAVTEEGKSQIFIEGLENSMGGYQLPTRNFVFALPKDTDVSSVTIETKNSKQVSNIELKNSKLATTNKDLKGEKSTEEKVEMNYSVQEKEGCKFVIFSISPIEYIEDEKKVNFYPNISVTVNLEEESWNVEQVTKDAIEYLKDMVDNPEMIDTYDVKIVACVGQRFYFTEQKGASLL